MNSNALATLSAHPVLATTFAAVLLIGTVYLVREAVRTLGDAAAARRARRLRREQVGLGVNHDGMFLTRH